MRKFRYVGLCFAALLTACTIGPKSGLDGAPHVHIDVSKIPDAKPCYLPRSKYGNPTSYRVFGKQYYVLKSAKGYHKRGYASWYGTKFHGHYTSTNERYSVFAMTAASPVLPIPTFVRVTNLQNGRHVIVKVNDRGPFARGRIMDLSYVAAKKLGYAAQGTAYIDVVAIDPLENGVPTYTQHSYAQHTPPPPSLAYPSHVVYLQLGVFSQRQNAVSLKNWATRYTSKPVRIEQSYAYSGRSLFKVQIGPFHTRAESEPLRYTLARSGLPRPVPIMS